MAARRPLRLDVENLRLESKARGDKAKLRKLVRKKPPEWDYAHWDAATFERLVRSEPEPLVSPFRVSHDKLGVKSKMEAGIAALRLGIVRLP